MGFESMKRASLVGTLVGAASALALVATLFTPLAVPSAVAADEAPAPAADGLSAETAAASCWEIKKNDPDSEDGVYWLVTPTLVAPQQFYCDQTEYGGGWVMIARGREGWTEDYDGLGTPAQITATPSGPGAFKPAQLPAATIDGLLDGGRPDRLTDGVRLDRASSIDGAYWQEVRFRFQQRDRWSWAMGSGIPLKNWVFGGWSGKGGRTSGFGHDSHGVSASFVERATHKGLAGWSYGASVTGTADASSYLWAPAGEGNAIPFTQMFLRPTLTLADLDFDDVPSTGTAASTVPAVPGSDAMKTVFGVSGETDDDPAEVDAFGEAAGAVYVGGDFQHVQRTKNGGGRTAQPYLAAFDVVSGEWVPAFRPRVDGPVTAIAALPDGRIAVGGRFHTVDGEPHAGIAFLDPTSGALSGTQIAVENRETGGTPVVRDLDVQGGSLYVAGSMTHLIGADGSSAPAENGGRIDIASGVPDPAWNPALNGTALSVDASDQGDRTYFAGYFTRASSASSKSAAALQTAAGAAPVEPRWAPAFTRTGLGARAVAEVAGRVYLSGARRTLASYDRNTFQLVSGSSTRSGSNIRSLAHDGAIVIGACDCEEYAQQYTGDALKNAARARKVRAIETDPIDLVGAWDGATGAYLPGWSPALTAVRGGGALSSFFDSTGTLWVGGDLRTSVRVGAKKQWSGGFARFPAGDGTPPTTPGAITSTPVAGGAEEVLTWGASADASTVVYEVLRGDRVVATTTASTYTVPITAEPTPYVVRARDAAGNRSAGTAAFVVQPPARSALTFIGDRDTWAWRYSAAAIGEDWTTAAYDDSSWHVGAAPFGAGVSGAATSINRLRSAGRPLSAQFRKAFEVRNAATVSDAVVSVIADDGAVVYLNGREIGRVRMPEGAVTQTSLATETVSPSTAAGARAVIVVPQGTLVDGPNILAVSVHTGDKEKPNMGFDLAFTAARAAPPKAVTGLSATSTADTVTLTWSASDGTAPASYVVRRDGTQVGTTTAPTVTFADGDLAASATHHYTVVAVAADGQTSPTASVQASTTADQPVIVPNGSVWSWRSSDEPLPGGWNALGFDSSGWASGPGVLGRGFGAATDIDPSRLRTKPVSAQFRHAFTVTHPASVKDGTVSVIADDGVVVYLNGVELGRSRLPGGAIGQNTVATGSTGARAAASHRVTFAVPARLLTKGTNVLAASVHANYRATPDLSFDLSLKMARG